MTRKLNWTKSQVKFPDSKRKLLKAQDYFEDNPRSIGDIKKEYQKISNKYAKIGIPINIACARHYKNINKWVHGTFTPAGDDVELYGDGEGEDSFGNLLDGDKIDGVQYYVVVDGDDSFFNAPKIHPAIKDLKQNSNRITKDIFKK